MLTGHRLAAAALGLGLGLLLQTLTRSLHPPAAATTLLVALVPCNPRPMRCVFWVAR